MKNLPFTYLKSKSDEEIIFSISNTSSDTTLYDLWYNCESFNIEKAIFTELCKRKSHYVQRMILTGWYDINARCNGMNGRMLNKQEIKVIKQIYDKKF